MKSLKKYPGFYSYKDPFSQCDQIWRNFAILVKFCSMWQKILSFYLAFGEILNLRRQFVVLLGKYSLF